jgi:hypothetical protein
MFLGVLLFLLLIIIPENLPVYQSTPSVEAGTINLFERRVPTDSVSSFVYYFSSVEYY